MYKKRLDKLEKIIHKRSTRRGGYTIEIVNGYKPLSLSQTFDDLTKKIMDSWDTPKLDQSKRSKDITRRKNDASRNDRKTKKTHDPPPCKAKGGELIHHGKKQGTENRTTIHKPSKEEIDAAHKQFLEDVLKWEPYNYHLYEK